MKLNEEALYRFARLKRLCEVYIPVQDIPLKLSSLVTKDCD